MAAVRDAKVTPGHDQPEIAPDRSMLLMAFSLTYVSRIFPPIMRSEGNGRYEVESLYKSGFANVSLVVEADQDNRLPCPVCLT